MIVMKFGGTSVGNAECFKRACDTIRRFIARRPLVVVSAVSGVTNLLDNAATRAAAGRSLLEEVISPHRSIIRDLGLEPRVLEKQFESLRSVLESIALAGELSPENRDEVHSFGERFSSAILAAHMTSMQVPSKAWDAGDAGNITSDMFGCARPIPGAAKLIRDWFASIGSEVPIVTGYIGRTLDGRRTTLGRGGSDLSGAIFAAALNAEELQIWTDVVGVMSADPRIVPHARTIPVLSFEEAAELAFRGAKVLHPDTVYPVREAGIPVRVLNSFAPGADGTLIVEKAIRAGVKCFTSQPDLLEWSFFEQFGIPRSHQICDALSVLSDHSLPISVLTTSESGFAVLTTYSPEYSKAVADLVRIARVSVQTHCALVSLVGEGVGSEGDSVEAACRTLREAGVAWRLLVTSPTGKSFSFVIEDANLSRALTALHANFPLI
ncbi:MAG: aspartate kinase [Candidatus Brocadiia bacterium]